MQDKHQHGFIELIVLIIENNPFDLQNKLLRYQCKDRHKGVTTAHFILTPLQGFLECNINETVHHEVVRDLTKELFWTPLCDC